MNNYDPGADWGRAGFNQRHRYSFTVNAQAPFGTMLAVDAYGNSGNPYNITTGQDDNGDQSTTDRPAGVARNSANGPRFFNVNMTLSKTFQLRASGGSPGGGGAQMSVYANVNNAFNIVNLRNPSGVLTSEYSRPPDVGQPGARRRDRHAVSVLMLVVLRSTFFVRSGCLGKHQAALVL